MKKAVIKIREINDATELVNKALRVEGHVTASKGKYCVDCKSLMGVFSLDLSTGVIIEYPEAAKEFDNFIRQFVV